MSVETVLIIALYYKQLLINLVHLRVVVGDQGRGGGHGDQVKRPLGKPALTVGIQVSLLGFCVSKVKFVNKFKLMENMI